MTSLPKCAQVTVRLGAPYTHTVLLHGPKPMLNITKKSTFSSNDKQVTCYTCIDEHDPLRKFSAPDYCGHRVGDRVKYYKGGLRGSVVWVSGCKTHVRVRVEGQQDLMSSDGLTNSSVIEGSDGSYTFNARAAAALRAEGKLIEHGGRWRSVGPDIDVEKSEIMSQRTAKEIYYAEHPPQLEKVDATAYDNNQVSHILTHSGNVGDHNVPVVYRVVGAAQHAPDPDAAGARPRRDAVANGNGFGERGKRRAESAAAAGNSGAILTHLCSARGTTVTSNMLYGSTQHADVPKFDHNRGAIPAEVLAPSVSRPSARPVTESSTRSEEPSTSTTERRARATAAESAAGYLRPTRASSARRAPDEAPRPAQTHGHTHGHTQGQGRPTQQAPSEAAEKKPVQRPLSARLLQPTQASSAMAAGAAAGPHGRLQPDQYGAVSARNGRAGLDKVPVAAGSGSLSARGWMTERDTARDSARDSARTARGHPVVDNWVPPR